MKYLFVLAMLLMTVPWYSQGQPAWKWAKSDTSAQVSINPSYIKEAVGVANNHALWGYLKNKKTNFGAAYGDNVLTEYDTLGVPTATTTITGNISLEQIAGDNAGNWYILADVFDTLRFAGGQAFTTNVMANDSKYFLFKLHAGTLALDWCQKLANNYLTTVNIITVQNNKLYLVTDSVTSRVYSLDLLNGNRTLLLTQTGGSRISSLQADELGNIYIAGGCADPYNGLNFNGTLSIPANPNQYPSYIVRYKSNGQHDWHMWMTDNTCVARKLTLATNNLIYYSGAVHDTTTLGSFHIRKPVWVHGFMIARLDSTGNVLWLSQPRDTLAGDADIEHAAHAVVSVDSSLTIFSNVRGYMDWGSGLTSTVSIYGQAACVHYKADGTPMWVKPITGLVTYAQQVAGNGTDVWVTGTGRDSFSYKFDAITVPAALIYPPYMARLYTGAKTATVGPSGVGNVTGNMLLVVQPNPATQSITISGMGNAHAPVWIGLVDMTGRIVCQKTLPAGTTGADIDVAAYARGVYVLQVKSDGVHYVQRVVLR